jgi:uncharacterized protein (UPF0335 family)
MPSLQLRTYLAARASGRTVEQACAESGIGPGEAELHEKDIASGELELPRAPAPARTHEEPKEESMTTPSTTSGQKLRLYIERVERLEEEIKGLNGDKSDVYQEAKSDGFDTATMKRIIKLRKMDASKRQEAEALLETYMNELGMTPIEHAIAMAA